MKHSSCESVGEESPISLFPSFEATAALALLRASSWDDELRCKHLNDVAVLVACLAAYDDGPTIRTRARRGDFYDLTLDLQDIARPRRFRPTHFAPSTDNATGKRQSPLD